MCKIAVFAGHGGNDPGAVTGNRKEKDFNLEVSNQVTTLLRNWGYTVINNRTTDVDRNITKDANLANENKVDALVEIHLNSNNGNPGTGTEAFVSVRNIGKSRQLATEILKRISSLGFVNRGVKTAVSLNGTDAFGILRLTNMPAVLVELAFINNSADMARFRASDMAFAVASGIRDVFPIIKNPIVSLPPYPGALIRLNSRGENVVLVQKALNSVGKKHPAIKPLVEDGIFGPKTLEAVTTFQRLFSLVPDGIVGPLTWAALARES